MKNFFLLIDFCSSGVELGIDGKTRQTSLIGGFISLLISISVIFLIIYLGLDIILKEKPRLIISETEIAIPDYFNYSAKEFMFGFKITNLANENVNYTDYLSVSLSNTIGIKKENVSLGESSFQVNESYYNELINCNKVPEYQSLNLSSTLQAYTCIKDLNFFFGGEYSNKKYGSLDFMLTPCRGKETCRTREEIQEFVDSGLYFTIFYRDNLVDPKKSETPIQTIHAPFIIGFGSSLQIDSYFYYNNLEVKSDN
jgi:hypothetical protein